MNSMIFRAIGKRSFSSSASLRASSVGIVGMPNVGKSTLFNALTSTQKAEASNFPFCTIEPNVGKVSVPDARLMTLAKIAHSEKIIPTQVEFVDIAGLVRGASKGEGLGNQFLSNIRNVSAICQVVRCFEDDNITHVEGRVDPIRDIDTIQTELMLADIDVLERRRTGNTSKKMQPKEREALMRVVDKCLEALQDAKPVWSVAGSVFAPEDVPIVASLQLLTAKRTLFVCNVDEGSVPDGNTLTRLVKERVEQEGARAVVVCAKLEQEISAEPEEATRQELLATYGLQRTGLEQIIQAAYGLLDLQTFYTCGPKEARAWPVKRQSTAPEAAATIHTDLQKGFIRAETISYDDYVACQGEQRAKELGKMRLEGKEYVCRDGDVFYFRSSL